MDIIEALSVVDKADVIYWDDDPEKTDAPLLQDQLFFRQAFDVEKPKNEQLSVRCLGQTFASVTKCLTDPPDDMRRQVSDQPRRGPHPMPILLRVASCSLSRRQSREGCWRKH